MMTKGKQQKKVAEAVFENEVDSIDAGISDSKNNVFIEAGGNDAQFTAVEARIFANELYNVSHIEWETTDNDVIWRYILDLCDVVDQKMSESDFNNKWEM